ncbi:NAD(P)/FAD-dependent oxidoreductase [Simiduia aestuariiviva]|uniref:Glycine/D-amino acid oxidase-like deaminating enzyme n=1 Tax=Simiduia aestuariiviva TaxID=1510459 RepID=A0A839UQU6_9GAMM|nr:FAD-dependent oxidoreductase [Simiduia aestuariiviva]MBB3167745.1 glycine/D-amino acid oxidase-like deaminating enzyme [Simiduia aestuariiviva]
MAPPKAPDPIGPAAPECYWADTATAPQLPPVSLDSSYDLIVIGAGFTGMNAALTAAEAGMQVLVLDAHAPGWGASGRNGGFCCIGGDHLGITAIANRFGEDDAKRYALGQLAAIDHVAALCENHGIDADRCGQGEWVLAHKHERRADLLNYQRELAHFYGLQAQLRPTANLDSAGNINPYSQPALWTPTGFGLHPLKYLYGLIDTALARGAHIHAPARVTGLRASPAGWRVQGEDFQLRARRVLIATNAYTQDTLTRKLRGRLLPAQSNILVTQPLPADTLRAMHWAHLTPAYDTRRLLYYFRLLPDGRLLFGGRAGISESATSFAARRAQHTADFLQLFPAAHGLGIDYFWRGRVALSRSQTPHVAKLANGLYCALAFHGNGIAMGSWSGHQAVKLMLKAEHQLPDFMQRAPRRFPLPWLRPLYLAAAYVAYQWLD